MRDDSLHVILKSTQPGEECRLAEWPQVEGVEQQPVG
jgi:hypothetical protein